MDPRKRLVSEVMQTEVATLAPTERVDLVEDVMSLGRIRHMPVLDEGRVVGLVSNRDVLEQALTKTFELVDVAVSGRSPRALDAAWLGVSGRSRNEEPDLKGRDSHAAGGHRGRSL